MKERSRVSLFSEGRVRVYHCGVKPEREDEEGGSRLGNKYAFRVGKRLKCESNEGNSFSEEICGVRMTEGEKGAV